MSLSLRWVGDEEAGRVARARWLCYAHAARDLAKVEESLRADGRAVGGDYVLAERDGVAVGTATSLSMTMRVRGAAVPCQGVAWVGAAKTERRKPPGVASAVMAETLRKAREREQVVSALMPFRASFYEHFGYGVVERRAEWTVPLSVLPAGGAGDADGWRPLDPADVQALAACRGRMLEGSQCDVERTAAGWRLFRHKEESGFAFVRAAGQDVTAWALLVHAHTHGKDILRVEDWGADSPSAFRGVLHFLATLRDQYFAAVLPLPADFPLNLLLRESQVPHRPVNHPTAEVKLVTRMQVRVLDHRRFLEALRWPAPTAGRATVAVRESEGHVSKFRLDVADGRAAVSPSDAAPGFECPDRIWAAVACGELPASRAVRLGLADDPGGHASVLDALAQGPVPFCTEYF